FLGLKHALDADHLVAVSTIVSERKGFWNSSLVGALWGLGHTASLLAVGLLVIAFNFQIPSQIALAMEFAVAIMLVALGVNVLLKVFRGATFHIHTHSHEGHLHIHPHFHKSIEHRHGEHTAHHHSIPIGKKPFFVGALHGLAGSAALMLLVLAAISSRPLALAYIGIFGLGSVGGMFLMSALIGLPFSFTSKYEQVNKIIRTTAGVVSVCFGLFLAYQIGMVEGLFL
ncbi:MAG: urease accessory protein UreH, partial [candidate division Zixibacteria bacterium]|nr:urease accessory protein UreH [candidate division Zixibacteria bacterium]